MVLWKKFCFESWLPLNRWISPGQIVSISKYNFLFYEIGYYSSFTVLLVKIALYSVKPPYDFLPARYWKWLIISKSCKGHIWMCFDIFRLILHHIKLIDLLSFLLPREPFYRYTREQTRETKTAKIQIISLFISSPSKGLGERVGD